jgi:peptidyl-prolyl cis-trans isomerase C
MSRVLVVLSVAASLAACGGQKAAPGKGGPVVAQGEGVTITAEEFKAALDEQSPFVRQRFSTLERKKEFLDNMVRFELLAKEAEKQGLASDAEVQRTLKRIMVQKLVQRSFSEQDAAKSVPDQEVETYYASHQDEYKRPARVRLAHILVKSEPEAKKLLARLDAEQRKDPAAFARLAREASADEATKNVGGDVGFRTREELEKQLGKAVADAAFSLGDGQNAAAPLQSPQGFHLVKRTGWQDGIDRPLEAVKPQIAAKLAKERRAKDFDEYVKKLKDGAKVQVNDQELEKIAVPAAPGGAAPHGMGGPMGGGMAAPAPAPGPATAPAPAKAQ